MCVCSIVTLIAGLESVLATRSQVTNVFLERGVEKNANSFTLCLRGVSDFLFPLSVSLSGMVCVSVVVVVLGAGKQICWRR